MTKVLLSFVLLLIANINLVMGQTMPLGTDVSNLQSLPGAAAVVLIDTNGGTILGNTYSDSGMSDQDKYLAWRVVAEDFAPFNINITTNETLYNNTPITQRTVAFISYDSFAPNVTSGYSFDTFGDDSSGFDGQHQGGWVEADLNFVSGWRNYGEVLAHEIGHSFGLVHSSTLSIEYYTGQGFWAPIMGSNYTTNLTQWDRGEFQDAKYSIENHENLGPSHWSLAQREQFYIDKILIISNNKLDNGSTIGFRIDDHGNTIGNATALNIEDKGVVDGDNAANKGIITKRTDLDYFSFTLLTAGSINLTIASNEIAPNLNIKAELLDVSGNLVLSSDPTGQGNYSASFNTNLDAGTYFISVDGVGEGDPKDTGFSDYGSLGHFSLSGYIEEGQEPNQAAQVSFHYPANGSTAYVTPGSPLTFDINAEDIDGVIESISIAVDSKTLTPTLVSGNLYQVDWTPYSPVSFTANVTVTDNDGASSTAEVTFTVTWGTSYTVNYNGNGNTSGINPYESERFLSGEEATMLDEGNLLNEGYDFAGWNTSADGSGTHYDFDDKLSITENVTLYAMWELTLSVISYDISEVIIYPNPVQNTCYISGLGDGVMYQVFNTMGQKLLEGKYTKMGLDLSSLIRGVYLIRIKNETFKVLKN